jgi:hypothetical protein
LRDDLEVTSEQMTNGRFPTRVAVVARSPEDFGAIAQDPRWVEPQLRPDLRLWTDDYSSLLPIYRSSLGPSGH